MTRNAKIGAVSGRTPTALTLEFRIFDQGFVPLLITEMETLGYHIAKMIGVHPCLALRIKLCFYSRHDKHSFWNNSLARVHTRLIRKGSFMLKKVFRACVFG